MMRASRGFSLVELMVAVAVVAILAAVAIPSYSAYVIRSKRAQAKAVLHQEAQFLERNYSQASCYNYIDANGCNGGAGATAVVLPVSGAAPDYQMTSTLAAQTYTLSAIPCGSTTCTDGSAFLDPDCGTLTLDQTGAKGATAVSATATTATLNLSPVTLAAIQQCWGR